jgi:hypothetical protein
MDSTFESCIATVQELSGPEISLMFYNSGQELKDGANVDRIVQDHFVEYLSQDLSTFKAPQSLSTHIAGSLLHGDEKVGVERLIECL